MTVRLTAERLAGGGRALARHEGRVWLIDGALPGETVTAEREGERAGVVFARAVTLCDHPHPARSGEPLAADASCGGCDWSHVDPVAGGPLKADVAAGAARGLPELAARLAAATVRTSPAAYRLRARLHWDPTTAHLGFYRPHSHWVAAAGACRCRVLSRRLSDALEPLTAALATSCPAPVDLEWLEDLAGTTAAAALRPAKGGPAPRREWVPPPAAVAGAVDGLHLLNAGGRLTSVWGVSGVTMDLPVALEVPVGAFFQGNRHLVPWLFRRITELAGAAPVPAWDLHAGVGFLAAAAVTAAPRRVVVVEPFRPAARAAARNLPDATTVIGATAEAYLARHRELPPAALALMDPPRTGLTNDLRRRVTGWRPERILMLSCDPATWARDVSALESGGYRLTHLELIDLFPSTHHVEVLSLLEPA